MKGELLKVLKHDSLNNGLTKWTLWSSSLFLQKNINTVSKRQKGKVPVLN
jgi:hypothetical protein